MIVNSIDSGVEMLGDSFRGLWKSILVNHRGKKKDDGWAVTFLLKGELVETDYFDSPIEAISEAIEILVL